MPRRKRPKEASPATLESLKWELEQRGTVPLAELGLDEEQREALVRAARGQVEFFEVAGETFARRP